MFGVWLDPDVAGRQAGKSLVVGDNGDDATPLTPEEEAAEEGALFFTEGVKVWPCSEAQTSNILLLKLLTSF